MEDYEGGTRSSGRDTYMAIVLCLVVGVPIFVFFNIVTGGLFILLLVLMAGVAFLGVINYFLWGRSFSRETAGEREEEEMHARMEAEGWPYDDRPARTNRS